MEGIIIDRMGEMVMVVAVIDRMEGWVVGEAEGVGEAEAEEEAEVCVCVLRVCLRV